MIILGCFGGTTIYGNTHMYYTESPIFATDPGIQIHPGIHGSMAHLHVQKKSRAHLNADPMARSWSETRIIWGISGPEPWALLGLI